MKHWLRLRQIVHSIGVIIKGVESHEGEWSCPATCPRPASSIFPEGMPPKDHQRFLDGALPRLQADARIVGVVGAGSLITKTMDRFSDLDWSWLLPMSTGRRFRAIGSGSSRAWGSFSPVSRGSMSGSRGS